MYTIQLQIEGKGLAKWTQHVSVSTIDEIWPYVETFLYQLSGFYGVQFRLIADRHYWIYDRGTIIGELEISDYGKVEGKQDHRHSEYTKGHTHNRIFL